MISTICPRVAFQPSLRGRRHSSAAAAGPRAAGGPAGGGGEGGTLRSTAETTEIKRGMHENVVE
eukprot:1167662-Pyramimonas_sp.AAC.1